MWKGLENPPGGKVYKENESEGWPTEKFLLRVGGRGAGQGPAMPTGKKSNCKMKTFIFPKTMFIETLEEKDRQRLQLLSKSMEIK
jgi:hypothetical protein